jgi:hypothetical protein
VNRLLIENSRWPSQFNWFCGFWQEDFQGFNQSEHVIGPGSHVEFPIYTNLVEDHPLNNMAARAHNVFWLVESKKNLLVRNH